MDYGIITYVNLFIQLFDCIKNEIIFNIYIYV